LSALAPGSRLNLPVVVERLTLSECAYHNSCKGRDKGPTDDNERDSVRSGPGGAEKTFEEFENGILEDP
jgi:hypothetical protein